MNRALDLSVELICPDNERCVLYVLLLEACCRRVKRFTCWAFLGNSTTSVLANLLSNKGFMSLDGVDSGYHLHPSKYSGILPLGRFQQNLSHTHTLALLAHT